MPFIVVFELFYKSVNCRKLMIMQTKLFPIEMQMNCVLYYAIVYCPVDTSFVSLCKFISTFLIAFVCVVLGIFL